MESKFYFLLSFLIASVAEYSSAQDNINDIQVRLVDGEDETEGRVEIYWNGEWGSICDDSFSMVTANIVCRMLGYDDALTYVHSGKFGLSKGPIHMDDVECGGDESHIASCPFNGWGVTDCSHHEDVGVRCNKRFLPGSEKEKEAEAKKDPFDIGSLRLRPAKGDKKRIPQLQGFVEVKFNDKWKKVCVSEWTWQVATVVCGQLGFPAAEQFRDEDAYLAKERHKRHSYWVSNITCTGVENKLAGCKLDRLDKAEPFKCSSGRPLVTKCVSGFRYVKKRVKQFNFQSPRKHSTMIVKKTLGGGAAKLRLRSGPREGEGRLEYMRDGRWGGICHREGWDLKAGSVACRQMGFGTAISAPRNSFYGQAHGGPIWITALQCDGSEINLEACNYRNVSYEYDSYEVHMTDCTYAETVGVACHVPTLKTHQGIRLVGGRNPMEGRVEVRVGKKWGPVCSDTWTAKEALVVCRHLGFGFALYALQDVYYYHGTEGVNTIMMTGVDCDGSESALHYCNRHRTPGECGDPKRTLTPYAGVICTDVAPDLIQDVALLQETAFFENRALHDLYCAHEEQCLAQSADYVKWPFGSRQLLRFSTRVWNRGRADFRPARTQDQWEWHECHNHFHSMGVFTHYDLIDANHTRVAQGHKASFCLEDTECDYGVKKRYDCDQPDGGIQGIAVGCADNYRYNIDCQWIDITDVKEGNYLLRIHVNPDALVPESDFTNNVVYCKVRYDTFRAWVWNCHTPDDFDERTKAMFIDLPSYP